MTTRAFVTSLLSLVVLMAGCGGNDGDPPEQRLGERSAPPGTTLVAALGDSITAGSPLWDPDPAVRDQLGSRADPNSQYERWVQRRLPDTRFRNCGVFGERTDEIARRLDRCVRGAQVLIVQGGINDIAQERPVADAAADLRRMVVRGRSRGLRVALVEVLPWNNGPPGSAAKIKALNRAIHLIGSRERVPVYPWYRAVEDPGTPEQMHPDWTIDGDHPSVEGYKRLAARVRLPGR